MCHAGTQTCDNNEIVEVARVVAKQIRHETQQVAVAAAHVHDRLTPLELHTRLHHKQRIQHTQRVKNAQRVKHNHTHNIGSLTFQIESHATCC